MHGELVDMTNVPYTEPIDVEIEDHIEDMIRDLAKEGFWHAHATYYEKL